MDICAGAGAPSSVTGRHQTGQVTVQPAGRLVAWLGDGNGPAVAYVTVFMKARLHRLPAG